MPGPPDAPDSLGDLFLAVSRLLRRDYLDALEPHGITPHQGRALRVVVDRGPLRLGMLAEALRVAPRSVTDVVDALETAGLVRRFPDPDDRRAIAVEATDAGRATAEATGRLRREHADGFFGSLTDSDRRDLARLLGSLLNQGQH